ncbi:MAG: wax ester/triacylglycerol synthase family O-acyltransferase [Deltaproteobacteria bacterium]|nr:wax ester/triacylglycerol synthase family O-acyltransferase [Deltaproteobacteria bacterium]
MERLTGLDAGFLYMETPTLYMHTLKIGLIDPSTSPAGYSFERFHDEMAKRLHLLPAFRRRVIEVPGGFHHPVWIEDPDFDLDRHIHREVIPAPGGFREMDAMVAEIASRRLDRRRPLWEMWAIEGLEGGLVAFVTKIHHSIADGVAAAAMLANVMTQDPEAIEPVASPRPWSPEAVPPRGRLLRDAFLDHLRQLARLARLIRRTVRALVAVTRHRRTIEVSPPLPFAAPQTRFNQSLSPLRSFATTSMTLADFLTVKSAFAVTVNDVVLAACAGSLRRYLDRRGELPERSLVAGVPVSTASPDEALRLTGNRLSNIFTSLATDIADPVQRLRAIHDVTREAKGLHTLLGADMLQEWVEYTPPRPYAAAVRLYSHLRISDRVRPPLNVVVSNVPGPSRPLYVAGARLMNVFSVGPVLEGIGLNLTAWSYLGQMNLAAIACRRALPNLYEITDGVREAMEELVQAARRR